MKHFYIFFLTIFFSWLEAGIAPQTATLNNGLKVVVFKNPNLPSVTVYTCYNVGTADDPTDLVGLSHMLEHMMFKGTPKYPNGEMGKILNRLGESLSNAYTTWDNTVYQFSVPAEHLEKVLDIEADRMKNLNFSNKSFLSEQKVVMEERKMRLDNNPFCDSIEATQRAMYTVHPYGILPIGLEEHIKAYTHDTLMSHYKQWYTPNNATVIVIGPYDLDHVLPLVKTKFKHLERQDLPTRQRIPEPARQGLTTTIEQENPKSENIYIEIRYRAPTLITKPEEFQKMKMLVETLFGNDTRTLYKEMVKEKHLALTVSCNYEYGRDDKEFSFTLTLSPEMSVENAESYLFTRIDQFLKKGLCEKDFSDAKQEQLNSLAFAMDGDNFLISLGELVADGFPVEAFPKYEQIIRGITSNQVQEMLAMVLSQPPVVISRNYPKGKMPHRSYQKVLKERSKI